MSYAAPVVAHRFLLCARIPYFHAFLTNSFQDSASSEFSLPFDTSVIRAIVSYARTGVVEELRPDDLQSPASKTATKGLSQDLLPFYSSLIKAADFLQFDALKDDLVNKLYDLVHGCRCDCVTCRAGSGLAKVAGLALKLNLNGFLYDITWIMSRLWWSVLDARPVLDLPDSLLKSVTNSILDSIQPDTLSTFLEFCSLLDDPTDSSPHSAPFSHVASLSLARCRTLAADSLPLVWRRDTRLRASLAADAGGSPTTPRLSGGRPVHQRVFQLALAGLRESNCLPLVRALDAIRDDLDHATARATDAPAFDGLANVPRDERRNRLERAREEVLEVRRDALRFVAAHWMNLALGGALQDVPEAIVNEVAVAAGVTLAEIKKAAGGFGKPSKPADPPRKAAGMVKSRDSVASKPTPSTSTRSSPAVKRTSNVSTKSVGSLAASSSSSSPRVVRQAAPSKPPVGASRSASTPGLTTPQSAHSPRPSMLPVPRKPK
ncbi:hypothetical protein HDU96_006315 [Phlyctochytrium bullatum]|nr:hypothetical protein HDU96_006315 [Phlyctochytrium bullatum]